MKLFRSIEKRLAPENIIFKGILTHDKIPAELDIREKELVARAVSKRRADFAFGRTCVKDVLSELGIGPVPVLSGEAGEPLWPDGVCGSIAHTSGAACAAAAVIDRYRSIGIDIESRKRRILPGAEDIFENDREKEWLGRKGPERAGYERMIFCAKETVYKLLFPLVRKRFGFSVVSLSRAPEKGGWEAVMEKDLDGEFRREVRIQGYYFMDEDWLVTAAFL